MEKRLDELSAEELGALFPIILSDPRADWNDLYEAEKIILTNALGSDIVRIEHIGSTAIRGIKAKPTIDILVEIREAADCPALIGRMRAAGYEYSRQPDNPPPHMMFNKGYTPSGFRGQAVHTHVRYPGDWDEFYFRDYLNGHPDVAREYESLKLNLEKEHKNNREDYTNGKTEFVQRISALARREAKEAVPKR